MNPLGLYVHLPWCARKCPYCDFNSHVASGPVPEQRYVDALLADLDYELGSVPAARISSVFIGGGTPSLFSGAAIARLLEGIAARIALAPECEVTLEANPGSAEAARFGAYRAAGVNRLSLGIQSFDDARLAALGRVHDAQAALAAIAAARAAGFDNLNLDLMFGLPGALPGAALRDLERALACEPEHLSWYQLTLEAGTAFARRPPALPGHDDISDDYEAGLDLLARAGYEHYEISAHARAGRRACHNLNYWRFGDYLGIGAGAHGKLTGCDGRIRRRAKRTNPAHYMASVHAGTATAHERVVGADEVLLEFMLNVLRLREGFTLADASARTGIAADAPALAAPLATALARGWLERCGERIVPSARGFAFLNDLQLLFVEPEGVAAPLQH